MLATQTLRLTDHMHSTSLIGNIRAVVAVSVFVMNEEEHHAKEEADGAHGYVGDAQEGVFPSHPGDGAEDHSLPALKAAHGVVWGASGWGNNINSELIQIYPINQCVHFA